MFNRLSVVIVNVTLAVAPQSDIVEALQIIDRGDALQRLQELVIINVDIV